MEKPKFVYVTLIATTPEKLWAALTSPEFTQQYWFGCRINSTWQVGAPVTLDDGDGTVLAGEVLRVEPTTTLSYTFQPQRDAEQRAERPSRVVFEIEPMGDGPGVQGNAVKLTVTHDDFAENSKVFTGISNGWPSVLSGLKTLLETGRALEVVKTCGGGK